MADIEIKLVEVSDQAVEWRIWATHLAGVLNMLDLHFTGRLDIDILKSSIKDMEHYTIQSLGIQQETFNAILNALGRNRYPEETRDPQFWKGTWPTT